MGTEVSGGRIDRRRFLRRAAVVGAAAAWATPVVRTITGTPAFAQDVAGSPIGGDLALSVCFTMEAPVGDTGPDGPSGGGPKGSGTATATLTTTEESCVDPMGSEYFAVSATGGDAGGGDEDGGGDPKGTQSVQSSAQTIEVFLTPVGAAAGAKIVSATADCGAGVVSAAGDYAVITCAG